MLRHVWENWGRSLQFTVGTYPALMKKKKLLVEEVDSMWKFWVLLDFHDLSCNRLYWRFSVIKRCYEYIYRSESVELLGEGPFKDLYWIQILLWHTNWHFWETKCSTGFISFFHGSKCRSKPKVFAQDVCGLSLHGNPLHPHYVWHCIIWASEYTCSSSLI